MTHKNQGHPIATFRVSEDRLIHIAITAFAIVLLVVIIAAIELSTLGLNFGSLVYGSNKLWPGHRAAFRVAAIDPQTTRFINNIHATLSITDSQGMQHTTSATGDLFATLNIDVPRHLKRNPQTETAITVALNNALGHDQLTTHLRVVDAPRSYCPVQSHLAALDEQAAATQNNPVDYAIHLYPIGGQAVRGLENVIFGRVTHRGQPLQTTITGNGFALDTASGPQGLFRFTHQARIKTETLSFVLHHNNTQPTLSIPLMFHPTQLRLDLVPSAFAQPGSTLRAYVNALRFQGPVHIDVWAGEVLIEARSMATTRGQLMVEIYIPKDFKGLLRVEAYRTLWSDSNTSMGSVWVGHQDNPKDMEALRACLRPHIGHDPLIDALVHGDLATQNLTTAALSRVLPKQSGMPLLRSNMQERRIRLAHTLARRRKHIHVFLAMTLIVGLGLMVSWVMRHQFKVQKQLQHVLEQDPEHNSDARHEASSMAGISHTYDLVMALMALLLAGYGIWMLVTRISWLQHFAG